MDDFGMIMVMITDGMIELWIIYLMGLLLDENDDDDDDCQVYDEYLLFFCCAKIHCCVWKWEWITQFAMISPFISQFPKKFPSGALNKRPPAPSPQVPEAQPVPDPANEATKGSKIHPFWSSVNHLFLWAIYTMAMLVITRG